MTCQFVFCWSYVVLINCKPGKSLVVYVDPPRIHRCDHDINPQVKLESVNQKWIRYVLGDDAALINRHFRDIAYLNLIFCHLQWKFLCLEMSSVVWWSINCFALWIWPCGSGCRSLQTRLEVCRSQGWYWTPLYHTSLTFLWGLQSIDLFLLIHKNKESG